MANLPGWSCVRRNSSCDAALPQVIPCSLLGLCLLFGSVTACPLQGENSSLSRHTGMGAQRPALTPRNCPAVQVLGTANSHLPCGLWLPQSLRWRGRAGPSEVEQALCWIYGKRTSWEQACSPPTRTGSSLGETLPDVPEHLGVSLHYQSRDGPPLCLKAEFWWK